MLDHVAPEGADEETRALIRDSVVAFAEAAGGPAHFRAVRASDGGFDRASWTTMAEAGWIGMHLAEDAGGAGMGTLGLASAMEELGRYLMTEPMAATGTLALGALAHAPDGEARRHAVAGITAGQRVAALCHLERAGGYGEPGATTLDGGHLSGTKRFVLPGGDLDDLVVRAEAPDGPVLLLVPANADGVTISAERAVDSGLLGTVGFSRVPCDDIAIIARGEAARAAIARATEEARIAVSAELLGVMRGALASTVDYVKERKQFGKPIGSFQVLQHRLVDMFVQVELTAAVVAKAARALDAAPDARQTLAEVSAAKARANRASAFVTRQAIQLYGGMGYTDECDIGLYAKRALALSAFLGNTPWHRHRFAATAAKEDI